MLTKVLNVVLLLLVLVAVVGHREAARGRRRGRVARLRCGGARRDRDRPPDGRPDPGTRAVVAAASVMRFPALALALASVTRQAQRLIPVILVYVIAAFVVLAGYGLVMSRHRRERAAAPPLRVVPRTT